MQWPPEESNNPQELHDFRTSNWYVGASTSPKDLAIMFDISSSMTSDALHLAKLTVVTIINTLGDDDFFNVFTFADTTQELVPCFKNMLVQVIRFFFQNKKKCKIIEIIIEIFKGFNLLLIEIFSDLIFFIIILLNCTNYYKSFFLYIKLENILP